MMTNSREETQLLSDRVRAFLWRRCVEITGVALMLLAGMLAIILLSADKYDPTINTASGQEVQNWFGSFGANLAGILYDSFGLAALGLSLAFLLWGWRLLIDKGLPNWNFKVPFLIIALCMLSASTHSFLQIEGSDGGGGLIGYLVLKQTDAWLASWGANTWMHAWVKGAGFALWGIALFLWGGGVKLTQIKGVGKIMARLSFVIKILAWGKKRIGDKIRLRNLNHQKTKSGPDKSIKDKSIKNKYGSKRQNAARAPRLEPVLTSPPRPQEETRLDIAPEDFRLPPHHLLKTPEQQTDGPDHETLQKNAVDLKQVLQDFRIQGTIDEVRYGPVVTRYDLNPAPGTKSQRVIALADDIARSMSALAVRVAVVPGQNVIGIELPNEKREIVLLRHILDEPKWSDHKAGLPLALGKDIAGMPVIADLARMPHLLVAGTTGSGKSVGINGMILSLLYRFAPEACRLILIDPKMLELSVYDGIPHLLTPVVTDPSKAVMALKWAVREMENRYRNMAKMGVRNIDGYNQRLADARTTGEMLTRRVQTGFDAETGKPIFEEDVLDLAPLPYIVVVIDEVADLMMVAGKEIEAAVQRLAQMARAAGIHVIMATQRPSVDVITGTIKANFPTRISFQVTSRIDSRTILGEQGAEQLLGLGDMLFMEGGGRIVRVHGPFVDDKEVEQVANFLRQQGEPEYNESVTEDEEEVAERWEDHDRDETAVAITGHSLYDDAVALVIREQKASTSFIQRHLKIGYNRAATLIEEMETAGIISHANHVGKRDVLISNENT